MHSPRIAPVRPAARLGTVLGLLCFAGLVPAQAQAPEYSSRTAVDTETFIYSETVAITGIDNGAAVVVNPANDTQYSIDRGRFTNDAGSIDAGQTLTLRHVSGDGPGQTVTSSVQVGDATATFISITAGVAPTPPPGPVVRLNLEAFGSGVDGHSYTTAPDGLCTEDTPNTALDCASNVPITVTAVAPDGSYFAGWYDTPECAHDGLDGLPYRLTCTVTLDEDQDEPRTLLAAFAAEPAPTPDNEADAPTCDNTVSQHCFYPFPSNVFTRAANATDPSSETGLQVNLVPAGRFPTPRPDDGTTGGGAQFDPTQWNRNDGFSLNPKINSFIDTDPGPAQVGADEDDLEATGVTHLADLSRSLEPDATVLMINATPMIDAAGNPCVDGDGCVDNPAYLEQQLIWVEPELPKRELRDTNDNGMLDTRQIPDSERTLTIRVGKNLNYRHRYIVAVRNFKRADRDPDDGSVVGSSRVEADPLFRIYRDNRELLPAFPNMQARRAAMEDIFAVLDEAGVARWQLNQAWDFTVASKENLHKRLLHMRDDTLAQLDAADPLGRWGEGEGVPCYTIEEFPNASDTGVPSGPDDFDPPRPVSAPYSESTCAPGELPADIPENPGFENNPNSQTQRYVSGTVAVPCYMTGNCAPGTELNYNPATGPGQHPVFGDDLPDQIPGSIFKANFQCRIPPSATAANPARVSLYGHGLLGSLGEVRNGSHVGRFSETYNVMFCAMNWTGFATEDGGTAAQVGSDVSAFSTFIDRQMQGHIAWLVMQEALARPDGLMAHPAFQDGDGTTAGEPLYRLDFNADGSGGIFYDGNSQGGIMPGAMLAISNRITRGVLGVPGMNYSILLRRSSDFQIENGFMPDPSDPGDAVGAPTINFALQQNFPNDFDLSFIYSLSTMIWERSENAGFAQHMGPNPLREDLAPKQYLLHVGYGDHQVAMWTADIIARSADMARMDPMVLDGRYDIDHPTSGTVYGEQRPYFGVPIIEQYPHPGGALVYWDDTLVDGVEQDPDDILTMDDFGVDTQIFYNAPQRTGRDPHEFPRRAPQGILQKSLFLQSDVNGGGLFDTCAEALDTSDGQDGGPCLADDRTDRR